MCFQSKWSGRRGSNSRPSAWKADALSTELLPQETDRSARLLFGRRRFATLAVSAKTDRIGACRSLARCSHTASGFRNSNRFFAWEVMDSNHRRRTPADLQSAPFGHSGNFPYFSSATGDRHSAVRTTPVIHTAPYRDSFFIEPSTSSLAPSSASAFRADGGIRTHDQLITNQLLWPTELHRQIDRFGLQK